MKVRYLFNITIVVVFVAALLFTLPPVSATTIYGGIAHESSTPSSPGIVGIDFRIPKSRGFPWIEDVYPGTPAAKVGLKRGDTVLSVNGVPTLGLPYYAVDNAISDVPGDNVQLLVKRHSKVFPVMLTVISLEDVPSRNIQSLYEKMLPR